MPLVLKARSISLRHSTSKQVFSTRMTQMTSIHGPRPKLQQCQGLKLNATGLKAVPDTEIFKPTEAVLTTIITPKYPDRAVPQLSLKRSQSTTSRPSCPVASRYSLSLSRQRGFEASKNSSLAKRSSAHLLSGTEQKTRRDQRRRT